MIKSWRPEGWKVPREVDEKSFEVGADAMLAAIRKKAQPNFLAFLHHCIGQVPEITIGKGVYFFLPDEKEE